MIVENFAAAYRNTTTASCASGAAGARMRTLGADLELTAPSMDELAVIGVISSVEYITTE